MREDLRADRSDVDLRVFRENIEGTYANVGGNLKEG